MANPPEIFAKWAVIFPSQHTQDVKNFVTSVLMSVSKGMQYEIPYPELYVSF